MPPYNPLAPTQTLMSQGTVFSGPASNRRYGSRATVQQGIPANTGIVNPTAPVGDPLATGGPSTLGYTPKSFGGANGAGGAGQFLSALYNARPSFVQQQGELLKSLGPGIRNSIFSASPELAQAAQYYQKAFSDPFAGQLSQYQDLTRASQAAHGFTGGGSAITGDEAARLQMMATNRQDSLLPGMIGYGQQILGNSGLQAPPDLTLSAIGGLALQNQNQQFQQQSATQQSQLANQMYQDYVKSQQQPAQQYGPTGIPLNRGAGGGVVSNPFGAGGRGFTAGGGNSNSGQFSGMTPAQYSSAVANGGQGTSGNGYTTGFGGGAGSRPGGAGNGAGQYFPGYQQGGGGGSAGGSAAGGGYAGPMFDANTGALIPGGAGSGNGWGQASGGAAVGAVNSGNQIDANAIEAYKIRYATGQTTQNIQDYFGANGPGSLSN